MKAGQMAGGRPALLNILCNNPSVAADPVHNAPLSTRTTDGTSIWPAPLLNMTVGLSRKAASSTEEPETFEGPSSCQQGMQQHHHDPDVAIDETEGQQACRGCDAAACTRAPARQQAGCTASILGCRVETASSRLAQRSPSSTAGGTSQQGCVKDKQCTRPTSRHLTRAHQGSIRKRHSRGASRPKVRCSEAICLIHGCNITAFLMCPCPPSGACAWGGKQRHQQTVSNQERPYG